MWNASTTGSPGLGLAHLLNPKMEAHREYYDLPKSQNQTVAKPGSESRATDSDPVVFLLYHHFRVWFGLVWFPNYSDTLSTLSISFSRAMTFFFFFCTLLLLLLIVSLVV